jgi:hypothetical protein
VGGKDASFSPQDARHRIEKDCFGIWSRRTIIDALPDEAKNPEKQKAGPLRQKEHILLHFLQQKSDNITGSWLSMWMEELLIPT